MKSRQRSHVTMLRIRLLIAYVRKKNPQANSQFTVVPNWWGTPEDQPLPLQGRTLPGYQDRALSQAASSSQFVQGLPHCRVPPCPSQSQFTTSGKEKLGNFKQMWDIVTGKLWSSHHVNGGSVRPELHCIFFLCSVLLLLTSWVFITNVYFDFNYSFNLCFQRTLQATIGNTLRCLTDSQMLLFLIQAFAHAVRKTFTVHYT